MLQAEFYFPLNNGSVGNTPHGGNPPGYRGGITFGGEAGNGHRALTHGIHFAVGAVEWRYQQSAALQAVGVAQGAHGHVNAGPLCREGRQIGCNHDRCNIVGP